MNGRSDLPQPDRPQDPSRPYQNITSTVIPNDLSDAKRLLSLLQNCYGPRAKKQSIGKSENVRAFTSISSRILANLNIKNPFNSLIKGGVQSHNSKHKDGGCLLAILTLQLMTIWRDEDSGSGKVGRQLPTALAAEMLEFLADHLLNFGGEKLTFALDVTSFKDLTMIVRSVLTSNWIFFNGETRQLDHFVALILKLFVSGIADGNGGGDGGSDDGASFSMPEIHFRHVNGLDLTESRLENGLFVPSPTDWEDPPTSSGKILVAVFDISLSGDSDEYIQSTSDAEIYASSRFLDVDIFLEKAITFFDYLIDDFKISIILCQRVIHPRLQSHLHSRRVRFIHRLSAESTPSVCRISGAKLFSSVILPETGAELLLSRIGRFESIKRVRLPDEKYYLQLTGCQTTFSTSSSITPSSDSSVRTLLICSPTEENYSETKSLIETCLACLKSALQSPVFVDGGGCHLAQLLSHLSSSSDSLVERLTSELGLPTKMLAICGIDVVSRALRRTLMAMTPTEARLNSVVDHSFGHHWIVDSSEEDEASMNCVCGRMTGKWSVVEENVMHASDLFCVTDGSERKCDYNRIVDSYAVISDVIRTSFQLSAILIHTDKVIAVR